MMDLHPSENIGPRGGWCVRNRKLSVGVIVVDQERQSRVLLTDIPAAENRALYEAEESINSRDEWHILLTPEESHQIDGMAK